MRHYIANARRPGKLLGRHKCVHTGHILRGSYWEILLTHSQGDGLVREIDAQVKVAADKGLLPADLAHEEIVVIGQGCGDRAINALCHLFSRLKGIHVIAVDEEAFISVRRSLSDEGSPVFGY